ncbi:MAG TPA: alpha/beta fold hydrolase [Candidatus Babeliales bacterium]|nr:alpha/beta fold hydrolase [Candidatus Babeliales bacterium]
MKSSLFALSALLAATAAAPPAAPILPDGTYRYQTSIGGQSVGTSTIVIDRSGGALAVSESATLAGHALVSKRTIQEANFATTDYSATVSGKQFIVTITGNDATLTADGKHTTIAAAAGAPFLVSDNMVAGFALIPAMLHVTGAKQLTLACLCGAYLAVPVAVTERHAGGATIAVEGQTGTLAFDPQTYVLQRFDLPSQQLSVVLKAHDPTVIPLPSPVAATPLPLPSAHYQSSDVSIRADDGVVLAGTLTVPDAPPALPAILFVHGSGCIDRDETIGPNKVFAQLANALSNNGFAVLRYDKRSCAKSGGTFATRDRLIADARDALAFLRAQPGIDPRRIFVLGHSEGGELAPSIAIADGSLRGIVLLAPPALPLEQIIMQQTLSTATDADRPTLQQTEQAQLAAIAAGQKTGAYNAWLRSSFGIDPAKIIAQVPCPILIVQGTKDVQVLAADTPRLAGAARSAQRDVTVVMLDGDDHLFIKLPADESSSGAEYFTPSYLDPALFTAIEAWLTQRAKVSS